MRLMHLCAAILCMSLGAESLATDTQFTLKIRVIHALKSGSGISPSLTDLKADLAQLNYSGFKLIDGHTKKVFEREVVALEYPGSRWLQVRTRGVKKGALQVSLKVRDLKFKAKVRIPDGSTILVGGPAHKGGNIILAVTATRL
jgi:hypothetical protein